jgi:hypothetical protein
MPLLRVTNHQASFLSPQRPESPLLVIRNLASMSFSALTAPWIVRRVICAMMATDNRALLHSLWNQMVRKNMGVHDEYHMIQQSWGMSPKGVRRRSLPEHNTPAKSMGAGIRQIIILARFGTLGPPPYSLKSGRRGDAAQCICSLSPTKKTICATWDARARHGPDRTHPALGSRSRHRTYWSTASGVWLHQRRATASMTAVCWSNLGLDHQVHATQRPGHTTHGPCSTTEGASSECCLRQMGHQHRRQRWLGVVDGRGSRVRSRGAFGVARVWATCIHFLVG